MERNIEEYLTKLVNDSNESNEADLLVSPAQINMIQEDLTQKYPEQVLQALLDDKVKEHLVDIVNHEYSFLLNYDKNLANYVVQECIGTGIIERILQDDAITDIGWNGKQLSVETNNNKWLINGKKLNISQEYIDKVIAKYAAVNDKSFNSGSPILDGMFKNIRISATHKDNSPDGATMSMRVSRPNLALNIDNFSDFAPEYIFDFLKKIMFVRSNICISG
ncbi:type II/IV secretion system protein, partial [Enterococcus hirae]|nr:type II/IV secretion system protein [Enterococcus hirae]